jgi:hypothetical protein
MSIADLLYSLFLLVVAHLIAQCVTESESATLVRPVSPETTCHTYLSLNTCLNEYAASSLSLLNILIQVYLTLERLLHLLNPTVIKSGDFKLVSVLCAAIAFTVYMPALFLHNIQTIETKLSARKMSRLDSVLVRSDFGKSMTAVWIMNSLSLCKVVLVTVVLLTLNLTLLVKYWIRANNPRQVVEEIGKPKKYFP